MNREQRGGNREKRKVKKEKSAARETTFLFIDNCRWRLRNTHAKRGKRKDYYGD
jgi:hypothetical protein